MDLQQLIQHPEKMNKETLYDLRALTALHPYYQTARLLLLQNLYLLHDSSFDDELRRAAIYITDRTKLFELVESGHYQWHNREQKATSDKADRTLSLIDDFLDGSTKENTASTPKDKRRKPTAADATIDYVAYLLESDNEAATTPPTEMRGQSLIDQFIDKEGGRIQLPDSASDSSDLTESDKSSSDSAKESEEGYFTATLARIYVKQGRYSKALEIIKRLNLNYPKKSAYFADQIRFLEKLIINSKK